jgi:hypothetical protein
MNNQQAQQLLDNLGSTADEVAANLKDQGITGRRQRCYSCPIAKFLNKNGAPECAVGSSMIRIALTEEPFKPSFTIQTFINSFDSGAYPELDA